MKEWIRMVCGACGLVASNPDDENGLSSIPLTTAVTGNTPQTAARTTTTTTEETTTSTADDADSNHHQISSPYIHISECYTGIRPSKPDSSGSSRPEVPVINHIRSNSASATGSNDLKHKISRDNSVTTNPFRNSIRSNSKTTPPPIRGATIANLNDSFASGGPEEVRVSSLRLDNQSDLVVLPPDRPPKPAHLVHFHPALSSTPSASFDNYANSSDMQNIYEANNNNNNNNNCFNPGLKLARNSDGFSAPSVSRDLKPGRKGSTTSGSYTIGGSPGSTSGHRGSTFATLGPPVERALKPKNSVLSTMSGSSSHSYSRSSSVRKHSSHFIPFPVSGDHGAAGSSPDDSDESPSRRHSTEEEQIYFYMPPVNTTSSCGGKVFPLMIPADSFEHPSVAYIDLDLPKPDEDDLVTSYSGSHTAPFKHVDHSSTIYKTIDIEKTEAFNRTKRDIENQRQNK